jgi:hypothetical protein
MYFPHPTMLFCGFQQREKIVSYRLIVITVLKDSTEICFGQKENKKRIDKGNEREEYRECKDHDRDGKFQNKIGE